MANGIACASRQRVFWRKQAVIHKKPLPAHEQFARYMLKYGVDPSRKVSMTSSHEFK